MRSARRVEELTIASTHEADMVTLAKPGVRIWEEKCLGYFVCGQTAVLTETFEARSYHFVYARIVANLPALHQHIAKCLSKRLGEPRDEHVMVADANPAIWCKPTHSPELTAAGGFRGYHDP